MKLKNLFEKLEKSEAWKNVKKENKDIFFCAGFIILNFKQNIFEYSLDYRDDKQLFGFKIPADDKGEIIFTQDKLLEAPKPLEKIDRSELTKLKVDLEDIRKLVEKSMEENKIKSKLDEIVAVLQNYEGKIIWNLTCICEGFTILNVHIDPFAGKVIKFEKKNLLDFASVKKPDKTL